MDTKQEKPSGEGRPSLANRVDLITIIVVHLFQRAELEPLYERCSKKLDVINQKNDDEALNNPLLFLCFSQYSHLVRECHSVNKGPKNFIFTSQSMETAKGMSPLYFKR